MENLKAFARRLWQWFGGWVKKGVDLAPFLAVGEFIPVVSLTRTGLKAGIGAMVLLTLWGNSTFVLKYVGPGLILSGGVPEIVLWKFISDSLQTIAAYVIVAVMKRPEV